MSSAMLARVPPSSGQAAVDPDSRDGDEPSDSSSDGGACGWLDELPRRGPITMTPFDQRLWESLLDCGRPVYWAGRTSNGNNNRRSATSEEPIPPSAAAAEVPSGQHQGRVGASPVGRVTTLRLGREGSTRTLSCSPSGTPRAVRVVNWAAEPCDKRWNRTDADRVRAEIQQRTAKKKRAKCRDRTSALRKAKLLVKRLPPSDADAVASVRPKSFYRVPVRTGGVNGVEVFLSSVADSPRVSFPGNAELPTNERPSPSAKQLSPRPPCLLEAKNAAAVAPSGSQDGSTTYRIPTSDTPWRFANMRRGRPESSVVTMEISDDSSSDEEKEASAETVRQFRQSSGAIRRSPASALPLAQPVEASGRVSATLDRVTSATLPAALPVKFRPSSLVVTVSEIGGGGCGRLASAASAANSKTTSTHTEQSASTLACASEASRGSASALEARASLVRIGTREINWAAAPYDQGAQPISARWCCAPTAQEVPGVALATVSCHGLGQPGADLERLHGSTGDVGLRLSLHEPLAALSAQGLRLRLHAARILLRHKALGVAPVWVLHAGSQLPEGSCVASLSQCPTDCGHFAWPASQPARCSRACCQLLSGPLDSSSQSSESSLALHRSPVYSHHRAERATTALSMVDRQQTAPCLWVTVPEVRAALRFVAPSESGASSPEIGSQQPVPLLWPNYLTAASAASVRPAQLATFNAVPSGNEATSLEAPDDVRQPTGRRGQQLRELSRIVRMKMRRKLQEDELVGVSCCSCCSLTSSEDSSRQTAQASGCLERRLDGLLDSLRSCRQTAAAAASLTGAAASSRQSADRRQGLVSFIDRILRESTSQQAALNDLLAALKAEGGGVGEAANSPQVFTSPPGSPGSSQSEQFYSPDAGTRASRPTAADQFQSPDTRDCCRAVVGSANNNAKDADTGDGGGNSCATSGTAGGRRSHRTYYARRRIVRLEEGAAIQVQEAACRASSLVAVCSVNQFNDDDDSDQNGSCCSSSVQAASLASASRFCPERLRALESRVLSRAWLKPPISIRLLRRLDPTVASFMWWSFIPMDRRGALSPAAGRGRQPPPPSLASQLEFGHQTLSSSSSDQTDAVSATIGRVVIVSLPVSPD